MFFGAPDHRELAILAEKENPVRVGYDKEGVMHPLPFILQLQQFELEYNGSGGTLSQYRSDILIDGEPKSVSVNNPITHGAYKLYQNGYDKEDGAYSVFRLVYDPWLWGVWLGILLLALGSLTMILRKI